MRNETRTRFINWICLDRIDTINHGESWSKINENGILASLIPCCNESLKEDWEIRSIKWLFVYINVRKNAHIYIT